MKVVFSSMIVISLGLLMLLSFGLPVLEWFDLFDADAGMMIVGIYTFAGIGVIGLLITLIIDRIKSKKEEDANDYRKY